MDELEYSKIFGAACAALLAFVGFGQLGKAAVSVNQLDEPAYVVEIAEADDADGGADAEEEKTIGEIFAMADLERGKKVFGKCKSCHKVAPDGGNGVGPNLWGIVGKPIASADGFSYSAALAEKGGDWDWEAMNGFILKPKAWAKGTKMGFAGVSSDEDRASVIAWLNDQSDNPLPLPE